MRSTMPLRVGDDLLASAKLAAEATGRSAAQQVGHWAKLGRELERSGSVSVREVAAVLAGARSYDDLDPKAQANVRAEWDARIEARRAALNLAELFTAEGRSWVEAGHDGATVRHRAADEIAVDSGRRRRAAPVRKGTPARKTARSTQKTDREQQPVRQAASKRKESTPGTKTAGAAAKKKAIVTNAGAPKKTSTRAR